MSDGNGKVITLPSAEDRNRSPKGGATTGRKVALSLLETYGLLNGKVANHMETRPPGVEISCKKGCNHCCHPIVIATFAEALVIANELLTNRKQQIPAVLQDLEVAIGHLQSPEMTTQSYFKEQHPCAFLKDGLCSVYEARPSTCRFSYVRSPPEMCSVDHVSEMGIEAFDTKKFSKQVMDESFALMQHKFGQKWMGPLQVMVWWALKLLREGREAFDACRQMGELTDRNIDRWTFWVEMIRRPQEDMVQL